MSQTQSLELPSSVAVLGKYAKQTGQLAHGLLKNLGTMIGNAVSSSDVARLNTQVTQTEKQVKELERLLAASIEHATNLEVSERECQERVKVMEAKYASCQDELFENKTAVAQLEVCALNQKTCDEKVFAALNQFKACQAQSDKCKMQQLDLHKQIEELNQKLISNTGRIGELQSTIEEFRSAKSSNDKQTRLITTQLNSLETDLETCQTKNSELTESLKLYSLNVKSLSGAQDQFTQKSKEYQEMIRAEKVKRDKLGLSIQSRIDEAVDLEQRAYAKRLKEKEEAIAKWKTRAESCESQCQTKTNEFVQQLLDFLHPRISKTMLPKEQQYGDLQELMQEMANQPEDQESEAGVSSESEESQ